jgi:N-acetylglucosamine kinase-like BadF-type ATPase
LVGGFAGAVETWLAPQTTSRLLEPIGDAVQGAVTLARSAAQSLKHVA